MIHKNFINCLIIVLLLLLCATVVVPVAGGDIQSEEPGNVSRGQGYWNGTLTVDWNDWDDSNFRSVSSEGNSDGFGHQRNSTGVKNRRGNTIYIYSIPVACSIIVGIISAVVAMFGMAVLPGTSLLATLGGGIIAAVLVIVILAVVGMIVDFILGAIVAFIYNLAAGVFGGLRIDLE